MKSGTTQPDPYTTTLEAFADTIVPGEKRAADDVAIAGAAPGPGAVAAGAVELMRTPATGIDAGLDAMVDSLNEHARVHAAGRGLDIGDAVPAFVALPFAERTAVVRELTTPGHPEKDAWISLALFANMAFDTGAHLPTAQAVADGHPGLTMMGFAAPDPDGLWRFPKYSYGRPLAEPHPGTTATGSPA